MHFIRASRPVIALAAAVGLAASSGAKPETSKEKSQWEPAKTRAFIVCLAKFKGEKKPSFTTNDRLDGHFVELLKKRGVPAAHVVFLQDQNATAKNIKKEFTDFLRKSQAGETLFFYYGSHGAFDPKSGVHSYVAFDDWLPMTWAFDAIEKDFKGGKALMFADCCFSGGLIELAKKRKTAIAYGCLSSTYCHQTASSGWRFIQCLMRGLEGSPVVARTPDAEIDLEGLAHYTERYMAFCAEGKPMFTTTNGLNPRLHLAKVSGKKADPHIGKLLEVKSGKTWYPAEVLEAKGKQFKIHYTADTQTKNDCWVGPDAVRPFAPPHFTVGTKGEVRSTCGDCDGKWIPATVADSWESLHFCRPQGRPSTYDGWFGPSGIRKAR
jgi:hypothetical protein